MSELNINRNIFLEQEELIKFQSFLKDDPAANVFLGNTTQFGVIKTDFVSDQDFLVQVGTNVGTIKIPILSKALDINKNLIYQEAIDNISVPNDSSYYWVKISHTFRRYEVGTVSVDINGNLVGNNTLFTEVLRGQSTKVPVTIKFYKESGLLNTGTYQVLGITDDLSCVLQGDFVAESDLRYIILGSIAIGETVTSQIEEGLYKYDSCNLELIAEEISETPPTTGYTEDEDFYIARVINNSGTVTIEDQRQFWEFNITGISDKLSISNNLSEVDPSVARGNLDVYSTAQVLELLNIDNSGWLSMSIGSKLNPDGTNIKIRRVGNYVHINGVFTIAVGQSLVAEDILFYIPYSSIGLKAAPSKTVYWQFNVIETENLNHGVQGEVEYYDGNQGNLTVIAKGNQLYLPSSASGKNIHFNLFYIGG